MAHLPANQISSVQFADGEESDRGVGILSEWPEVIMNLERWDRHLVESTGGDDTAWDMIIAKARQWAYDHADICDPDDFETFIQDQVWQPEDFPLQWVITPTQALRRLAAQCTCPICIMPMIMCPHYIDAKDDDEIYRPPPPMISNTTE